MMLHRYLASIALALSLAAFGVPARGAVSNPLQSETIVAGWNDATLEAIREGGVPAPIAARALAIVDTSMYDAWTAYDGRASGMYLHAKRPNAERSRAAIERAISVAAYDALSDVVPSPVADVTLAQYGQVLGRGDAAESIGHAAAAAVLAFRHRDGANQLPDPRFAYRDTTGYVPVNSTDRVVDPNRWQPQLVYDGRGGFVRQHFLTPQWASVTPFALAPVGKSLVATTPLGVDDPRFREQARELVDISANLTDREKTIAEYWADGPGTDSPPGHWIRIALFVSQRDRHTTGDDAKLFFALSNAMLDASIACWRLKRTYDSARPVTGIRYLFAGQWIRSWGGPGRGTESIDGTAWRPYQASNVVTPPFPEFVSGHSTFSAAGATVLERFTGSDRYDGRYVQRARTSFVERDVPMRDVILAWTTFSAAADEAGISRRYGGIHYRRGDLCGRALGRAVGAGTWARARALFGGRDVRVTPFASIVCDT